MPLPVDFRFSQSSLQDYVDCQRRFELRYLKDLKWPSLKVEPALEAEKYLQQGALFHRLVQQYQIGLPVQSLEKMVKTDDLRLWWQNYLKHPPANLPETRHVERTLSAKLAGYQIMAIYDLIAIEPARRAVIVDWKTAKKRPKRSHLEQRIQTRVYPYLLVKAGHHLNGGQPLRPEQIEMLYWFAAFPDNPERFTCSQAQFEADESYLSNLITDIKAKAESLPGEKESRLNPALPQTTQEFLCKFCTFRSFCGRGDQPGTLTEFQAGIEEETDIFFDFSDVDDLEF